MRRRGETCGCGGGKGDEGVRKDEPTVGSDLSRSRDQNDVANAARERDVPNNQPKGTDGGEGRSRADWTREEPPGRGLDVRRSDAGRGWREQPGQTQGTKREPGEGQPGREAKATTARRAGIASATMSAW